MGRLSSGFWIMTGQWPCPRRIRPGYLAFPLPPFAGQPDGAPDDGVEHLGGQLAGERVLLAGVEGADQRVRTDDGLLPVAEGRARPSAELAKRRQGPEGTVPGEGTERQDHSNHV